jgi:hypothetical protein
MRISPIVLRLREANMTRFETRIAGSAELGLALGNTLIAEVAFVIQTSEDAQPNELDREVAQEVTETFAVIVALKNDTEQSDKTGIISYDSLYDVRKEILDTLLGWQMPEEPGTQVVSLVEYGGGRLLDISPVWLWYQYDFNVIFRITRDIDISDLNDLNSLYADWILVPSKDIPLVGPDGLPVDITITDMQSYIDFTENPDAGSYGKGFGYGFKLFGG